MKVYQSRYTKLAGRTYIDVERKARKIHNDIAKATKRSPYIRSVYFKKDKVFIDLFWSHLNQKSRSDRKRRLKYYEAAIDLLEHTTQVPLIKPNPNGKHEEVYRFAGLTKENELFYVQVKEDKAGHKYFMSVFPSE